jgi:hypothetical protein
LEIQGGAKSRVILRTARSSGYNYSTFAHFHRETLRDCGECIQDKTSLKLRKREKPLSEALPAMSSRSTTATLGTVVGLASAATFLGANLGISFITVPTLLLPSPASPLPAPANSENKASPTSTASPKPGTKASDLARQWQTVFDIGKKAGPVLALLASGSWLYTFQRLPASSTLQRRLLLIAAGLSVSIVPFTFVAMSRTNNELIRRAEAATRGEDSDGKPDAQTGTVEHLQTHDLVRWWAKLNLM